jgi:hypothetical protein
MKSHVHLWTYLAYFFLEWGEYQTKFVEKIKTHCTLTLRVLFTLICGATYEVPNFKVIRNLFSQPFMDAMSGFDGLTWYFTCQYNRRVNRISVLWSFVLIKNLAERTRKIQLFCIIFAWGRSYCVRWLRLCEATHQTVSCHNSVWEWRE